MTSEMGQQQTEFHRPSVQFRRVADRRPKDISRGRGREIPLFTPADGSELDVHLIELDPAGPPGHYHLHTATDNIYLLLEGTIEVRHDGGIERLEAGDAVRFPPGAAHGAAVVGPVRAVLLEIYAPAGPDFVHVDEPAHPAGDS